MLTKKDFKAIAEIIRQNTVDLSTNKNISVIRKLTTATHLADYLEHQNPAFDREKFLTACGV
jgi:hypothetical protein